MKRTKHIIAQLTPVPIVYIRGNKEVAALMGLPDIDMVTKLVQEHKLPKYPRGKGFVFKVEDCLRVASMIDKGLLVAKSK